MREPEPPSPVYVPPLVPHPHPGICWASVVADIAKDNAERDKGATGLRQKYDVAEPEAA